MLTSAANMEKRAEALDFKPAEPEQAMYITIPGYAGREPAVRAPLPGPSQVVAQPLIKSSYTESLSDWLFQGFLSPLDKQVQP
jgi:hypothetical protein